VKRLLLLLLVMAAIAGCDRIVDLTPAPDAYGSDGSVSGGDGGNDGGIDAGNDGGGVNDGGGDGGLTDGGGAPDA
jgi:hypothetical protein